MQAWTRLQCLSCTHALQLWCDGATQRKYIRGVSVPEVIDENVKILGRGDEAEIKHRVHWYITFHPAIFDSCSASHWNIIA